MYLDPAVGWIGEGVLFVMALLTVYDMRRNKKLALSVFAAYLVLALAIFVLTSDSMSLAVNPVTQAFAR